MHGDAHNINSTRVSQACLDRSQNPMDLDEAYLNLKARC
jgi:hypothetical protein